MILEIGDLKERVTVLEKQINADSLAEIEKMPKFIPEKKKISFESYENLGKFYEEGYHICPMAYGEARWGECLFCIAFIEKE